MSLPAPDLLIAAMRRSGVIASSASVRVQTGTWATVVHADESTWILREIPTPTPSPVSILSLDREIEGRSPDIGLAIVPASDGTVWRLDRETDAKDLLRHLAATAGAAAADAMATVLALFQSGGPAERALLRPPELIGGLGIGSAIVSGMHAPRLVAVSDVSVDADGSMDGDWSLVFWSLASVSVVSGPIRSMLRHWTVTSRAGEVAWWSHPEWTSI